MAQRYEASPPPDTFLDAWISIGIGVFLVLFQPRFVQWLSSILFHTHFDPFLDSNNNPVPYQSVPEFWSDLGPTLFAVVLILDGLMLFTRSRALIRIAFVLTVITTLFNLGWLVISYSTYGLAVISFFAVLIGVFIASTQWRAIKK